MLRVRKMVATNADPNPNPNAPAPASTPVPPLTSTPTPIAPSSLDWRSTSHSWTTGPSVGCCKPREHSASATRARPDNSVTAQNAACRPSA
ncbi:MAG TPA: hypothetical protein VGN81_07055 [Pseudonocardiaceae bacterium]